MEHGFKVGDQVSVRNTQRGPLGGAAVTTVRIGTIIAFSSDGEKADVSFASINPSLSRAGSSLRMQDVSKTRSMVPIKNLQASTSRFGGRKVVQVNPNLRGIGSLIR